MPSARLDYSSLPPDAVLRLPDVLALVGLRRASVYPQASGLSYAEFGTSLSQEVGKGSISGEFSYAPAQTGTGDLDNVYLGVSGEMPLGETPLKLRGSIGYEDGAFGSNKLDWLVGAEYDLGKGFAAGVSYVDSYRSQLREGRAGVVGNLRFEF